MKIKSCEIKDFGKLSDRTLEFGDGINVVRGRNESGKSTLSHFVKYALYGFCGKGRDETGNEKTKFMPWSGKKTSGALTIEKENGEVYRIERNTDSKSTKCKIYNQSAEPCFEKEEPGDVFFGMDVCAFSKSAFVGQDDINPEDMKDIGAVLERLIMRSDDEDADYDKAIKSLTSAKNKLISKTGTSGRIPELTMELEELRTKRINASERYKKLVTTELCASETEKNLEECEKRLERLYAEAENIGAYKAAEMLAKLDEAQEKCIKSSEVYREVSEKSAINGCIPDRRLLDELTRAYSDYIASVPGYISSKNGLGDARAEYERLSDKIFEGNRFDTDVEKIGEKLDGLCERAQMLSDKVKKLKTLAIVFLCLVITIPISVILFVLSSKNKRKLSEMLGECGFDTVSELLEYRKMFGEVYGELLKVKKDIDVKSAAYEECKIKCAACEEMLYAVLLRIGYVDSREKIGECTEKIKDSLIPKIRSDVYEIEKAYSEYKENLNAYNALSSVSNREELTRLALKKKEEAPRRLKEDVDAAIKFDERAKEILTKRLSDYKAEIAGLGAVTEDPADIQNEVYRVENELSDLRTQLKAIELSARLMTEARDEIRGNVFPQVSKRAGELFASFTGGRYKALYFDKEFSVRFLEDGETETRSAGYLSSGTADAAYIALRVALSEALTDKKPPIVFDDSFAKTDDGRLGKILDVLYALSEEYQIIILTCHDREERILGDRCRVTVLDT